MKILVSGPSGAGKGTLIKRCRELHPSIRFSVSYTTRARRESELEGREYHFVSKEDFLDKISKGFFLEYKEVYGNLYGTAWYQVEKQTTAEHPLLLEIDVQGAEVVMERIPDIHTIFVLPPSMTELERRLRDRSTDSEEAVRIRLAKAPEEIRQVERYKYFVVNDDLDQALKFLDLLFGTLISGRQPNPAVFRNEHNLRAVLHALGVA